MIPLETPIDRIPKVGPRTMPKFKKIGIYTVRDLLYHFPLRYDDYSTIVPIADIGEVGSTASIQGLVMDIKTTISWRRRRFTITTADIEDKSGSIHVVWFNQPYIERFLMAGTPVSLAGKVAFDKRGLYLNNPTYERGIQTPGQATHTGRLVPKYAETEGITSKYLRFLIKPLLDTTDISSESLPIEILDRYDLPILRDALVGIHFPEQLAEAENARRRFAFEELFLFQLRALQERNKMTRMKAFNVQLDKVQIAHFVKRFPFTLTDDQRKAAYEILRDLERNFPMNRLLNGDVGSGKTIVALIAAYQVIKAHPDYQVVLMAPTEILARQHFETIKTIFNKEKDIFAGLLTGSEARQWPTDEITEEKISKKIIEEKIKSGQMRIVVGTHAVIQKNIYFKNPVLVIIDEQHRFGVSQRMALVKSERLAKNVPHLLSMTATPIPRTLALTIYGDLDVSIIKEKPKGRQKIITRVIADTRREDAYNFIDKEISHGRQVFVICPRIEINKEDQGPEHKVSIAKLLWAEVKAVTDEFEHLSKTIFSHRRVAMLHGKMKPKEKQKIMTDFKDHSFDILISTSVIEVGVDVPNASIMLIESSERFGLAQLHQFRGRVGRGSQQSYCFLFMTDSQTSTSRLKALEKTDSGFALAEIDLKLRGPGEFTGVKQSGMPDLGMASLSDIELIKSVRHEAKLLLENDPSLKKHPLLHKRLIEMQKIVHFE